jgi:hypothetical protein
MAFDRCVTGIAYETGLVLLDIYERKESGSPEN